MINTQHEYSSGVFLSPHLHLILCRDNYKKRRQGSKGPYLVPTICKIPLVLQYSVVAQRKARVHQALDTLANSLVRSLERNRIILMGSNSWCEQYWNVANFTRCCIPIQSAATSLMPQEVSLEPVFIATPTKMRCMFAILQGLDASVRDIVPLRGLGQSSRVPFSRKTTAPLSMAIFEQCPCTNMIDF